MSEEKFTPGPLTFDKAGAWYLRDQQGSAIMSNERYYPWVPDEEEYWQLFAAAPDMLALLKEYVAADPCAQGDPRYAKALELIERIEPKPPAPTRPRCVDCGIDLPEGQSIMCDACIPF